MMKKKCDLKKNRDRQSVLLGVNDEADGANDTHSYLRYTIVTRLAKEDRSHAALRALRFRQAWQMFTKEVYISSFWANSPVSVVCFVFPASSRDCWPTSARGSHRLPPSHPHLMSTPTTGVVTNELDRLIK